MKNLKDRLEEHIGTLTPLFSLTESHPSTVYALTYLAGEQTRKTAFYNTASSSSNNRSKQINASVSAKRTNK